MATAGDQVVRASGRRSRSGCNGSGLDGSGRCLAHADADLTDRVSGFRSDAVLDARGNRISPEPLARVLDGGGLGDDAPRRLGPVSLDGATSQGEAFFVQVTFGSHGSFDGATFEATQIMLYESMSTGLPRYAAGDLGGLGRLARRGGCLPVVRPRAGGS